MFDSLRSRLALSNLLITLLGLGVVVLVLTKLVAQRSEDIKRHELALQAAAVARQVERAYGEHLSGPALSSQIAAESRFVGERIIIVSPTGRHIVDSTRQTPFAKGSWTRLDLAALKSGRQATAALQSKHLILFQSPIHGTHGHRDGGAVLLVAPDAAVSPSLPSLLGVFGIAVGTALLVWLLIAWYFAFSISRPLLRIAAATREMGTGNYGARVPAAGHGEIADLAVAFNTMAERIQQSNQVLKDFVANVSHDLRTPLTMISGFSGALLDGTAGLDEVTESARVIHDEAHKMQHLVEDLLQLTRLESGLFTLDPHPTAVRPFVQATLDRVLRAAEPHAVPALVNAVPADLPLMNADSARLERVLRNLVDNAVQYTAPGGTVTVTAETREGEWIEIRVTDTGAGIRSEDLPRIFERFYRANKERERAGGHAGLGLAIVREIVEAHGGKVGVDSALGQGTTFRFTIPAAPSASAPNHPVGTERVRHPVPQ